MKTGHHNYIIVRNLIIMISALIFFSCKASKINTSNDISNIEIENEIEHQPIIVFVNCSLVFDTVRNEHNLSLINKIIVEGKIKETSEFEDNGKKDFGYCVLNKNALIILKKYMPYPLEQTVEYVDQWNNLQKKDIRLEEVQFSLRIPLTTEAKYISFFDRQEKQLLLIDLTK